MQLARRLSTPVKAHIRGRRATSTQRGGGRAARSAVGVHESGRHVASPPFDPRVGRGPTRNRGRASVGRPAQDPAGPRPKARPGLTGSISPDRPVSPTTPVSIAAWSSGMPSRTASAVLHVWADPAAEIRGCLPSSRLCERRIGAQFPSRDDRLAARRSAFSINPKLRDLGTAWSWYCRNSCWPGDMSKSMRRRSVYNTRPPARRELRAGGDL